MKKPKWHCSTCGSPFSRRWNASRHITDLHGGVGQPLLGTQEQADTSWQDPQSPSFSVTNPLDSFRQLRQYELDHGITVGFPDLLKPSWVYKAWGLIDRILTSYVKAQVVEFYNEKYNISSKEFIVPTTDVRIVGYRGMVCEKCLAICAIEILEQDGPVNVKPREHRCQVGRVFYSREYDENKRMVLRKQLSEEELPALMSMVIRRLEKKLGKKRYLYAVSIPVPRESCVHLDLSKYEMKYSYLKRAVLNGSARIDDNELLDFLKLSALNTFRAFQIKLLGDSYYLMGISFRKYDGNSA